MARRREQLASWTVRVLDSPSLTRAQNAMFLGRIVTWAVLIAVGLILWLSNALHEIGWVPSLFLGLGLLGLGRVLIGAGLYRLRQKVARRAIEEEHLDDSALRERARELSSQIYELLGDMEQAEPSPTSHWGAPDPTVAFAQYTSDTIRHMHQTMSRYRSRYEA